MISMLRARKSAADEADRTHTVCIVAAGLAPGMVAGFIARPHTARQHTGSAGGKV
jgi:hypothetical protein